MCISDSCTSKITNLQEAVNFLQMELLEKELCSDFEAKIKNFLYVNKDLNSMPVQTQRDLVYSLYTDCLRILLENAASREKVLSSRHYYWSIRVSLETYILYILRHVLLKSLSAGTAAEDAALNKITRNLSEIRLEDLLIRSDLQSRVDGGRLELSRLDCFVTVLGKIECLRRTVNYVSRGTTSVVSSDDLLPVLVYLVIKAGLSNWMAQLAFMQQFRFSARSAHETDEGSFLITSLEAAIEHVKSGTISRNVPCPESKREECVDALTTRHEISKQPSVEHLFACIEKGELAEVERILTRDKSPKQHHDIALCHPLCTCVSCERNWAHQQDLKTYPKDDRGFTPLHMAVLCNQTAIVDYLLDHEMDINIADADGLTALHHACIRGYQGILLHMLHANSDPTVTDFAGNTPLHHATERGHESCVKALLYLSEQMKVPVDVNAANDNGDTALHLAAKWGYVAIVRILLECGANCKLTNRKGQTPLTVTYSTYIGKLLEYYANVCTDSLQPRRAALSSQATQKQSQSGAPHTEHRAIDRLLAAIVEGDTCLACYYLGLEVYRERLPDVRCAVSGMCHPLCDCERCSAIGETLLERCKRRRALAINSCNSLGETALHVASATGRTDMVRLLLDAGANVNVTTASEGRTPLHLACLNGNVDLVKLLLNCATCYVDAQDYDGNTSLHLVSRAGNVKLVGLLLRHGANVDARNRHDMTPLRQLELEVSGALTANYADVLKMLRRNSPQPAQSSFDD